MSESKLLTIGIIAKKAAVNIQTIRYYERRGILKPASRRESGFRLYNKDAIQTILFIKHAQELGFKLDDIKELLGFRISTESRCKRVRKKANEKLEDVKGKIKMLKQIEFTLKKLVKDCENNVTSDSCPIIENIEVPGE